AGRQAFSRPRALNRRPRFRCGLVHLCPVKPGPESALLARPSARSNGVIPPRKCYRSQRSLLFATCANSNRHGYRAKLVQRRRALRGSAALLLRCRWRRHRRLQGLDRKARLPRRSRHQHHLAFALLSIASEGRRLRYRQLHGRASVARHAQRLQELFEGSPPAQSARRDGAGAEPHVGPAPLVPASTTGSSRQPASGFLCLERRPQSLLGCTHHFPGLRNLELDLGPSCQSLLLAPVLFEPTRLEFRQPRGSKSYALNRRFLVRDGRRWAAARCRAVSVRTRRDELRKST